MSEIAQAFVRIRPDTRGFEAEAQGGIRTAFTRLAQVAAGAFAIRETFEFGREIIQHAGDVQKQIEAIKDEFGAASEEVLKFNEGAAEGLGISAHLADTTSARFGILFKNLGIGQDAAAKMTVGFEQLGGALGAIRGLDPSTVLRNIPLAVAGNLRSLKQLGISTDQTQLKIAAFKLGLTSSITTALTPATRAQAIYAVATAHLGEFLQQAAANSGDLVNQQRILSAVWDNAKDRLGQGLLPFMTRLVVLLTRSLPVALDIAGRIFTDLGRTISAVTRPLGTVLQPLVSEIGAVARALAGGGIGAAIDKIRSDFASLSPAAKGVVAALGLIGAAFAILFVSAAPVTSLVLAIVGIAVAFQEAYQRSQPFRDSLDRIGQFINDSIVPALERLRPIADAAFTGLGDAITAGYQILLRVGGGIIDLVGQITDSFDKLAPGTRAAIGAITGIAIALAGLTLGPVVGVAVAVTGIVLALHEANRNASLQGVIRAIEGLRAPAERVADAIRNGIGQAIDFVGRHKEAFVVLAGVLVGVAAGFVALRVATVAWTVATRLATVAMTLFDVALDANPIGIIVLAIAALVGGLVALYTQSATARRILNTVFDGLEAAGRKALPVLEGIGRAIVGAVSGIAGFVTGTVVPIVRAIVTTIAPIVSTLVHTLVPVIKDFATTAAAGFDLALTAVQAFVNGALAVIRPFARIAAVAIQPFVDAVTTAFRLATSVARELWSAFGGTIIKVIRVDIETVGAIIRAGLQIVRGIFAIFKGLITGDWTKVWDGLKSVVKGTFDGIVALVRGEIRILSAVFKAIWDELEKISLEGFEKVIAILAKIPTKFTVLGRDIGFTNPFKAVDASLKATIDGLKGTATKAANEVPTAVAEAAAKANASAAKSIRDSANKAVTDAAKSTVDVVGQGADSAQAAAAAHAAATTAAKTVSDLQTQLNRTVQVQDANIAKTRAKLRAIGQQIADAVKQEAQDVTDAVRQASQNLTSIGSTLSDSIGRILDEPFNRAQQQISAQQNRQTLEALRRSVVLPGGGQLSADPKKALAQLQELARQSGNVNKAAIASFISQYRQAVLAVQQDKVNQVKATTNQQITDLTDSFNRGQISLTDYKKRILAILTRDHVSYKRAGALLGTAFANGFRDQVQGLFAQAAAIAATPGKFRAAADAGNVVQLVKPLDTLHKDQQAIAKLTHQKQDTQIALQRRIAKAAEATVALQKKIASVAVNPNAPTTAPSSTEKNPGTKSKIAKDLAGTTG